MTSRRCTTERVVHTLKPDSIALFEQYTDEFVTEMEG